MPFLALSQPNQSSKGKAASNPLTVNQLLAIRPCTYEK